MGRRAPGAAGAATGEAAVAAPATGAEPLAGATGGAVGDCACTEDHANKLQQAADSSERLKQVN